MAAPFSSVAEFENACNRFYSAASQQDRDQIEAALMVYSQKVELVPQCRAILDESDNPYAQHIVSSSLLKVITSQYGQFNADQRLDIRNYLLQFLATRGPDLHSYVLEVVVQLLARVSKLAWFENEAHTQIAEETNRFMSATPSHAAIGLSIFNALVSEFNRPIPARSISQHRKVAIAFRDKSLLEVFTTSLNILKQIASGPSGLNSAHGSAEDKMLEGALKLSRQCLNFDFIGSTPDESVDDLLTSHIPSTWKHLFESSETMQLFFFLYDNLQMPRQSQAMECLVQIASVRRSLFSSDNDRNAFLTGMINGMNNILAKKTGLSDETNFHEFCRLLAKLKAVYQLSELVSVENYKSWIEGIAYLTVDALQNTELSNSNSMHYLLTLWSRLVNSITYLKASSGSSMLEQYTPEVAKAFVMSKLSGVEAEVDNNEEVIEADQLTLDQLKSLATIGRCEYKVTADFIMQYFDPVASQFKECSEAAAVNPGLFRKLKILEGQVTWLVHIMASIIEGRLGMNASEEGDRLDGQLTGRVIALQQWHEARLTQHGCNGCSLLLENAFVHFYKSFKKIYIGDHSLTQSKAFEVLQDMVGIPNHIGVLNLMVHNITNNLRYWTDPSIIESTLQLFQELTSGYSTSRHMTKVETVQFILKNHSKDTFSFQESPGNFKSRTIFYSTLVKLLFMTPDDWEDRFNEFMIPFEKTFHYLNSLPSAETFRADSTKLVLMGMFRDLRGIASACSQRKPYTIFFEWVYERIKDLIIKVVELWFDCPELINIVLKFWSEFVQNRNQRLTFDSSSANGLLLFKHTSLLLKTLGSRLVTLPPRNDPWKDRYKLIHSFLLILHYSLGGNYCNFGVFELYQDPALTQALEVVLGLAFSIPRNELMSYPKLSKSFFDVIDSVTKSHLSVAIKCNDQILPSILQVVHDGLKSVAVSISSLCCTALEHICVQRYNALKKNNTVLIELFNSQSEQFGLILKTILTAVIFEDWPNQWSLSRPLFVLLLTNEQAYVILREEIIRSQAVERQEALMKAFEALTDVKKTLDATSRDKFSSLCNTFRVDVKAILGN